MSKNVYLGTAIGIATEAHINTFDRGGRPYILHPLHVMNQLLFDTELATIGVLHDVIEDSDVSISELYLMGFNTRICEALELLTHDKKDSYETYITRISTNYDAIRVKRKDLEHNSDITRLKGVTTKDLSRMKKYHNAFLRLGKAKAEFK